MGSRYGAFLLGVTVLALAAFVYAELRLLGFPDGHLTELDRARIPLHSVFIGLSVLCGLCSLYLAAAESGRRRHLGLRAVVPLYLVIVLATLLIDFHLGSYLDGGTGG
jgi:hypothetical protein